MTAYIGTATSRIDGRAKVTGEAKYAGEFSASGLDYGSVIESTIAKGRIVRIDTTEALRVEGVLDVLTHETGHEWPVPTMPGRTMSRRRRARRFGRSMTTRSSSAASRSRWCWQRNGKSRATRVAGERRMKGRPSSPTCTSSATRRLSLRSLTNRTATPTSLCGSRGAAPGRVFYPDRTSQPDGIVCLHGDLGRRRQARCL